MATLISQLSVFAQLNKKILACENKMKPKFFAWESMKISAILCQNPTQGQRITALQHGESKIYEKSVHELKIVKF